MHDTPAHAHLDLGTIRLRATVLDRSVKSVAVIAVSRDYEDASVTLLRVTAHDVAPPLARVDRYDHATGWHHLANLAGRVTVPTDPAPTTHGRDWATECALRGYAMACGRPVDTIVHAPDPDLAPAPTPATT